MLALASVESLVSALVWLVCIGVGFWLLWWLIGYANPPEPFAKVARVLLALVAVVILLTLLMQVAGPTPRLLR